MKITFKKILLLIAVGLLLWYWPNISKFGKRLGMELDIDSCLDIGGCWDYCTKECVGGRHKDKGKTQEEKEAESQKCQDSKRCAPPWLK